MKRLFFALWPDDETRIQVDRFNRSIKSDGLKKLKRDHLHVTLVFLGHVSAESETKIRRRVENISVLPFVIYFDQLVYWRKPRILCLTAEQHDPQLLTLFDALKSAVDRCGIKTEERPYQPHITLARKAVRPVEVEVQPIAWRAQSFSLVESCSTPDGVHYQVLQNWPFNSTLSDY